MMKLILYLNTNEEDEKIEAVARATKMNFSVENIQTLIADHLSLSQ